MVRSARVAGFAVVFASVVTMATAGPPTSRFATSPRTGTTVPFGGGTITSRSDGSSATTRPFGSGAVITERDRRGGSITGSTQRFGSGSITRWSDGSTTEVRPFGSGSVTTDRPGRTTSPTRR